MTHGSGKSDRPIVPEKLPNKAEAVEGRGLAKGNPQEQNSSRTQSRIGLTHALERIRRAAKKDKKMQFTNLWHPVYDVNRLREAYYGLNPRSAPGIDGRMRPIGIPTLEDKILQRATTEVLNAVYEVEFKGYSYGFRPGRNQHKALDALYIALMKKRVNWVLDADIQAFFDTIDHEWLLKFIGHRIGDGRLLRQIARWLKAGVMEEGKLTRSEEGTPQGGSISPLLSNIYLHYVLDLWVEQWRKRQAHGDVIIVRYADDFVMGYQHKAEATQFLTELRGRFIKFNLSLHPEKTRLIEFGRPAAVERKRRGEGKPETFGFLGFTPICDVTRARGKYIVLRQTIRKRMGAKLREIKEELLDRLNDPIPRTGKWLRAVVGGYYRYHAVPRNLPAMLSFYRRVCQLWQAALNRRSHKAATGWKQMYKIINRWLPSPKVMHPYPEHRFGVTT
jgi:group II intron reverse transcriptase/maturase